MSSERAYLLGWLSASGRGGRRGLERRLARRDPSLARALAPAIEALPRPLRGAAELIDLSEAEGSSFLRGLFDARGRINRPLRAARTPRCTLKVTDPALRALVGRLSPSQFHEEPARLVWTDTNAMDLLGALYGGDGPARGDHRARFLAWSAWVPALSAGAHGARPPRLRFSRTHPDAVAPTKSRATDSGLDLTLIRVAREHGAVTLYGTGLVIEPEHGFYFDVVPRSSIVKTGYLLANSVGIIDRGYRGEILVPLTKIDPTAPPLGLPARVVQLVPRPIVDVEVEEVGRTGATSRGEGGFGSTGP